MEDENKQKEIKGEEKEMEVKEGEELRTKRI